MKLRVGQHVCYRSPFRREPQTGVVEKINIAYSDRSNWRPNVKINLDVPFEIDRVLTDLYGLHTHDIVHRDTVINIIN